METTSVIRNIHGDGSWESQYGIFYRFEYEFEDGTVLKASHKEQKSPFSIGETVVYQITKTSEFGKMGKVSKPKEQFYGKQKGGTGSPASFALSYAKDMAVANIANGNPMSSKDVMEVADAFYKWLTEKM